jgi:hypothetical protein
LMAFASSVFLLFLIVLNAARWFCKSVKILLFWSPEEMLVVVLLIN